MHQGPGGCAHTAGPLLFFWEEIVGRSQFFRPEGQRVECKRGMKLRPMPTVDLKRTHGSESPPLTPINCLALGLALDQSKHSTNKTVLNQNYLKNYMDYCSLVQVHSSDKEECPRPLSSWKVSSLTYSPEKSYFCALNVSESCCIPTGSPHLLCHIVQWMLVGWLYLMIFIAFLKLYFLQMRSDKSEALMKPQRKNSPLSQSICYTSQPIAN